MPCGERGLREASFIVQQRMEMLRKAVANLEKNGEHDRADHFRACIDQLNSTAVDIEGARLKALAESNLARRTR